MRKSCFCGGIVLLTVLFCLAASSQEPNSTRTVSGHQIGHYKNGPMPVDLSAGPVAAYVPSGSGYTVIAGTGTSSGKFTIPGVPTGFNLIQFGTNYLWTNDTLVNADSYAAYRSNTVPANSRTI